MGGIGLCRVGASVDIDRRAPDLNQLDVQHSFTWGSRGPACSQPIGAPGYVDSAAVGARRRAAWSETFNLFPLTIRQLQGNVLYEFGAGDAKVRPFVFGGIGATFFSGADLQSAKAVCLIMAGASTFSRRRGIGIIAQAHFQADGTARPDRPCDVSDRFGFMAAHGCDRVSSRWGR